jgi:PRC-barrel domain protein
VRAVAHLDFSFVRMRPARLSRGRARTPAAQRRPVILASPLHDGGCSWSQASSSKGKSEMLRSANKIIGHRLNAVDGEIGRAADFLLDEKNWVLRYLVVDTGPWLSKRRVLISPVALNKADWTSRRMVLTGTTREQVKTAPALDGDAPLTREHEVDLSHHYGWDVCGLGGYPADAGAAPMPDLDSPKLAERHLGSVKELLGFGIVAEDGRVGHVEDFIVDDDTWSLRYVVIESRNWLSGRKILLSTDQIARVNWADRQVEVAAPAAQIEGGPVYDPAAPVYDRVDEPSFDAGRAPDPRTPEARGETASARFWGLGPPETWGTRGLRAALARIIHG